MSEGNTTAAVDRSHGCRWMPLMAQEIWLRVARPKLSDLMHGRAG